LRQLLDGGPGRILKKRRVSRKRQRKLHTGREYDVETLRIRKPHNELHPAGGKLDFLHASLVTDLRYRFFGKRLLRGRDDEYLMLLLSLERYELRTGHWPRPEMVFAEHYAIDCELFNGIEKEKWSWAMRPLHKIFH